MWETLSPNGWPNAQRGHRRRLSRCWWEQRHARLAPDGKSRIGREFLKQGLPEQVIEAEARPTCCCCQQPALNPPLGSCPGSLHSSHPASPCATAPSSRSTAGCATNASTSTCSGHWLRRGGDQRLEGGLQPPPATLRARLPGASCLRCSPAPIHDRLSLTGHLCHVLQSAVAVAYCGRPAGR